MATRSLRPETGSVALETAVLAPGLLMIVALLVLGGRVTIAAGAVEHAAAEAARSASLARTLDQAVVDGETTANRSLGQQDLECINTPDVSINAAAAFATAPGEPASVSATVTCDVALSDLLLPGLPGSRTVSETVDSPLDTYRSRQ